MTSDACTVELWEKLVSGSKRVVDLTIYRPRLAHYTRTENVLNIIKNRSLWMSNPLNMNDYQEVVGGLFFTLRYLTNERYMPPFFQAEKERRLLIGEFERLMKSYGETHAFDLYVGCFSAHDDGDFPDGKLSMWRGYGDNGLGAAIAFDTKEIKILPRSPLILAEVSYVNDSERADFVREKLEQLSSFLQEKNLDERGIAESFAIFFKRILIASIFSKHKGFEEEREWRLIYLPDLDLSNELRSMFGTAHTTEGLQPKLKLKLSKENPIFGDDFEMDDFIYKIMIGPRVNSPLNIFAMERELELIGRDKLKTRLVASSIPYRSR